MGQNGRRPKSVNTGLRCLPNKTESLFCTVRRAGFGFRACLEAYENHSMSSEWFGLLTKSKSEVKTAGLADGFAFDDEKPSFTFEGSSSVMVGASRSFVPPCQAYRCAYTDGNRCRFRLQALKRYSRITLIAVLSKAANVCSLFCISGDSCVWFGKEENS